MPVSDSRFDKLTNKINELSADFGRRIATLEGRSTTPHTLVNWLLGALSTALLIYLAWLGTTLYSHGNKLAVMGRDIEYILKSLPAAQLMKLQSATPTEENLTKTREVIQKSKAEKTTIPADVVTSVGNKLIQTAFSNPRLSSTAWNTTLDLISYRSFLTSLQSSDYRAKLERPSQGNPPPTLPRGIVLYWKGGGLTGGNQTIDGMMLEDVVFRDAHITYNGGPLVLKNVTFQNCTFAIRLVLPSQRLSEALLASSTVTLEIAS